MTPVVTERRRSRVSEPPSTHRRPPDHHRRRRVLRHRHGAPPRSSSGSAAEGSDRDQDHRVGGGRAGEDREAEAPIARQLVAEDVVEHEPAEHGQQDADHRGARRGEGPGQQVAHDERGHEDDAAGAGEALAVVLGQAAVGQHEVDGHGQDEQDRGAHPGPEPGGQGVRDERVVEREDPEVHGEDAGLPAGALGPVVEAVQQQEPGEGDEEEEHLTELGDLDVLAQHLGDLGVPPGQLGQQVHEDVGRGDAATDRGDHAVGDGPDALPEDRHEHVEDGQHRSGDRGAHQRGVG